MLQIVPIPFSTNIDAGGSDATSCVDSCEGTPTVLEDDPDGPAHRWREPTRSMAARKPSEAPRNAARPKLVAAKERREILCESGLEGKAALVLMARPDCAAIYEQPPAVRYIDHQGIARRHYFDFLMVLYSGTRIAVAVKPQSKAEKQNMVGLLKMIAKQTDPSFAQGIYLLTDARMSPAVVANAELIHDARRISHHWTDDRVRGVAGDLRRVATIDCIINAAGIDGDDQALYAVARAIGDGILVPVRPGLIERAMTVRSTAVPEMTK